MSITSIIKNIKEIVPEYIVLIKIGNFYDTYNKDAIILSYLFNYKIKEINEEKICGFPLVALNKVKYIMEQKAINYIILDKKNNYEEIDKMNYKKKNNYNEIFEKANLYINNINRINKIKNYLLNNTSKLDKIEKIIYE